MRTILGHFTLIDANRKCFSTEAGSDESCCGPAVCAKAFADIKCLIGRPAEFKECAPAASGADAKAEQANDKNAATDRKGLISLSVEGASEKFEKTKNNHAVLSLLRLLN